MLRTKTLLAVIIGLAAGGGHFIYLSHLEEKATGGDAVSVLSLAADVTSGKKITSELLATRTVPAAYADRRFVTAEQSDEVIDLVTGVDLRKGECLLWTDFTSRRGGHSPDLADLLEPGKRAATIHVNRTLSMGGLLKPGHRVDILGTFSETGKRGNRFTVALLQNVPVLATGKEILGAEHAEDERQEDENDDKSRYRSSQVRFSTVTLGVGLEDAELLSLASSHGTLSVALRGHQDLEIINGVPKVSTQDIATMERKTVQGKILNTTGAIERIRAR